MSRDYFSKSRKLSTNWCRFKERYRATTFFLFILNISTEHFTFGMTVHFTSRKHYERKYDFKCPNLILIHLNL